MKMMKEKISLITTHKTKTFKFATFNFSVLSLSFNNLSNNVKFDKTLDAKIARIILKRIINMCNLCILLKTLSILTFEWIPLWNDETHNINCKVKDQKIKWNRLNCIMSKKERDWKGEREKERNQESDRQKQWRKRIKRHKQRVKQWEREREIYTERERKYIAQARHLRSVKSSSWSQKKSSRLYFQRCLYSARLLPSSSNSSSHTLKQNKKYITKIVRFLFEEERKK